jgi:lysophospholipase
MGALLALSWIVRGKREGADYEFARRAFVSAPPLRLKMPVPAWKAGLAKLAEKLAPDIRISNGIAAEGLSYDVVNVEAYRADPLVHGDATPRLYNSMVLAAETVMARPQEVEIPLCLAVGADDPIVDPEAIKE